MNFIGYLKANQNDQSFPGTHPRTDPRTDPPTKSRMEAGTLPKNYQAVYIGLSNEYFEFLGSVPASIRDFVRPWVPG